MSNPKGKNAIVLFDGVCNLCNTTVQFIIDHDSPHYFRFVSLQFDVCQALLQEYGLPTNYLKSIVLIENMRCYTKFTAVFKIAKNLSGF